MSATLVELDGDRYEIRTNNEPVHLVTVAVQGPPGPPGTGGGGGAASYSAENKTAGTLPAGTPVAVHSTGAGVIAADATAAPPCVGLLLADTAAGHAGDVQTAGPLTLADWTAATGAASLTARAVYFLAAGGGLTTAAPATPGQRMQAVGRAVAPDTLDVTVFPPILL